MQLSVFVVILNWQRPEDTVACVRSVQADECSDMRVLVVDNGSTDDSVREISSACPDIEILKLPNNLGFARGINAGIQYAIKHQADLILLLNNDTVVKANAITELARSLDCNQNWSISVPKICHFDEPERIWAAGCRWRRFPPRVTMIGLGKRDASKYNRRRELDFATGCALLVRRTVFEDIGGFDPAFSSYQEDYDFCFRARQAGHRLVYIPRAEILHKVSQSLGENTPVR